MSRKIHAQTGQTHEGKTVVTVQLAYNRYTLLFRTRHDAAMFLNSLRRAQ